MIYVTKYLEVIPLKGSGKSILFNTLSGAIDLFDTNFCEDLEVASGKLSSIDSCITKNTIMLLKKRLYIFNDSGEEEHAFQKLIRKFDCVTSIYPKCYLSITKSCNAKCVYCYQGSHSGKESCNSLDTRMVSYALDYVQMLFKGFNLKKEMYP